MEIWSDGLSVSQMYAWTRCSLVLCLQNVTLWLMTLVSLNTQPIGSAKQSLICPFISASSCEETAGLSNEFLVSSACCFPPPPFLPEQFSNVDSSKDVHFCLTLSNISNLPHMFLMSCLMASAFWFCPTINGYNKHHFKHLSWVDVQDIYTHPF